jgi:hypothetical protein
LNMNNSFKLRTKKPISQLEIARQLYMIFDLKKEEINDYEKEEY